MMMVMVQMSFCRSMFRSGRGIRRFGGGGREGGLCRVALLGVVVVMVGELVVGSELMTHES